MNSDSILQLIDEARLAADLRDGALHFDVGRPASPQEIEECERAVGAELPLNLRSFLEYWNGMTVEYYDAGWSVESQSWSHKLDVLSTKMIARATDGVRDFFKISAEARPFPVDAQRRIDGLLVLSSQDDLIVYQALDRRDANGNCPVMEFNLEYYHDWLDDPGEPIAASVEEFVVRSLESHVSIRRHFLYWL